MTVVPTAYARGMQKILTPAGADAGYYNEGGGQADRVVSSLNETYSKAQSQKMM